MRTYDPAKHSITIGNNRIVQFGQDTFIKCSRNEDAFSLIIGADGNAVRVRNANRSGLIEITLLGSSPSNDLLQAQATLDELTGQGVVPATIKDNNGTALAGGQNVWIKKIPDLERAKAIGDVTWQMETDLLDLVQGGTLDVTT